MNCSFWVELGVFVEGDYFVKKKCRKEKERERVISKENSKKIDCPSYNVV